MSEIRWKLAEYMRFRGVTSDKLIATMGDTVAPEIVYRLVDNPEEQRQIDLNMVAAIMEGLILVTGFPVGVSEILEFVPHLPQEFLENSPWRDLFEKEYNEPYYPEDVDQTTLGQAVRYIPGVGLVLSDE
ncbi:MAG: hypothetical protein AB4352_17040 [Hormoscilla sp.]